MQCPICARYTREDQCPYCGTFIRCEECQAPKKMSYPEMGKAPVKSEGA